MRTPLHAALAALLALACGSDEDEDEVVETVEVRGEDEGGGQPEAEAPPDPDALPPLFSRSRPLMGTVLSGSGMEPASRSLSALPGPIAGALK